MGNVAERKCPACKKVHRPIRRECYIPGLREFRCRACGEVWEEGVPKEFKQCPRCKGTGKVREQP